MAIHPSDIEQAALGLPPEERVQLAQRLLASVDRDSTVRSAWDEEIRRRITAFEQGSGETLSADEVFAAARERSSR